MEAVKRDPGRARSTGTSRYTLVLAFRSAAMGTFLTYAINLGTLPFLINHVGAEIYGAWVTVASVIAIGVLADIGVRTEIVRRVAVAKGDDDPEGIERAVHEGVTLLAWLAGAIVMIGLVAAPAIRAFAFPNGVPGYDNGAIDGLVRAIFVLLAVSLLGNGYFGVLRGLQRGDVETVGRAVGVTLGAAAMLVLVTRGWGLWALFFGSAVQQLVALAWQWRATRRLVPGLRPRLVRLTRSEGRTYLALSGLVLVCQIGEVIDFQWDKLMLSRLVGSASVSDFQIGTNLVLQARTLAFLPLLPLLAAVAELRHNDSRRMEAFFSFLARLGTVLAAVILGAVFVFAPAFVHLWLGPEMTDAARAARVFVVAVAFNVVATPLAHRALAEGWHKLSAATAVVNIVVNGVLSLVLTLVIGFYGPLIGSVVGNFVGMVVLIVLMRRKLGERWTRPPVAPLVVGAVAALLAVLVHLDRVTSWLSLAAAGVLYVGVVGVACVVAGRLPVRSLLSRPKVEDLVAS